MCASKSRHKKEQVEQIEQADFLSQLPLPALALIYQYLNSDGHTALLRVSRIGRQTVLREARSIKLNPSGWNCSPADRKAPDPVAQKDVRSCS
jgi:hypothetical protein